MEKVLGRKHCVPAGCSDAEPKIFAPPQAPSQGRRITKI